MALMLRLLPAGLREPGDLASEALLTDRDAREAELAIHGARAAGEGAAIADADLAGVAGQGVQLRAGCGLVGIAGLGIADDRLEGSALGGVLGHQLALLFVGLDLTLRGHGD